MRVFISSTSDDLEPYRDVARTEVLEMGFEPVVPGNGGEPYTVGACARSIAACEAVLAIIGWRRGSVPGPDDGGDALRSFTHWEVTTAFRRAKPVMVFMAGDAWPYREDDSEARAAVRDFRGELDRLAVGFAEAAGDPAAGSPASLEDFRAKVHRELRRHQQGVALVSGAADSRSRFGCDFGLREWPPPEFPLRPYPLLLPYTHPRLLAGRERELGELRRLLRLDMAILGVHAPSGAGKSSLLMGGLIPELRAGGHPVAFDRHPTDPGLAQRLIDDLLVPDGRERSAFRLISDEPSSFVDLLLEVRRLAGKTPILVIDQFEDLLRPTTVTLTDSGLFQLNRSRAVAGSLLAATAQRQPGQAGPPCHWLLAYRQEFHGDLMHWLSDASADARRGKLRGADQLPHDLGSPDRFHSWALPTLGTPRSGQNRLDEATRAFLAAIKAPLEVRREGGQPRYPWRFHRGSAERLARAFGAARLARPDAPLTPELQVVLARLVEQSFQGDATAPSPDAPVWINVPEDPNRLIDQALEEHLRRALDSAFPSDGGALHRDAPARETRARALLALRELADAGGRRGRGLPAEVLARAIGPDGDQVLEGLSTPATRLLVLSEAEEGLTYTLSHDRMAELLVAVVEEEGRFTSAETLQAFHRRLAVDEEILALRRFVNLNAELYRGGESRQSTRVPKAQFRRIEAHADALLWDEDRRRWWEACRRGHRAARLRTWIAAAAAALAVALFVLAVVKWTGERARQEARLDQVAEGEPAEALATLVELASSDAADPAEVRSRLAQRFEPRDLFEHGAGDVEEARRSRVVIEAVEVALPLVDGTREQFPLIAGMVWALDVFAAADPLLADRAAELRELVLEPLRRRRPPPALPSGDDAGWIPVAGGRFRMGYDSGDDPNPPYSSAPRHDVEVSAFRLQAREVRRAEFRRLAGTVEAAEAGLDDGDLPAGVSWYEAYVYAAWLGGRLPTEAEWEYAARADCPHDYCDPDAAAATLDEVGWYRANAAHPETLEAFLRPPGQLLANPWGFYDLHGNAWEWTLDWFGPYSGEAQRDPIGASGGGRRVLRGGSIWNGPDLARPGARFAAPPGTVREITGFRVVLPSPAPRR